MNQEEPILMNQKERDRLQVLHEASQRHITQKQAAEQIGVTEQGVTAAEVLMDSYLKRQQLGLATTKDVLDVSASLTQARENYTAARADYQVAFTNLRRATGELLDRQGVRLTGNAIAPGKRKGTP